MQSNNQVNQILQANTTISIESLSGKQILGQCIDLATGVLRQLVIHYLEVNKIEYPFGQKVDFSVLMNYLLDPTRLDNILDQYAKSDDKGMRSLIRNWLHQLKYLRNCWAHSQSINPRYAIRSFDTLSLLFQALAGNQQSQIYQRIQGYRRALIISHAKYCLS